MQGRNVEKTKSYISNTGVGDSSENSRVFCQYLLEVGSKQGNIFLLEFEETGSMNYLT